MGTRSETPVRLDRIDLVADAAAIDKFLGKSRLSDPEQVAALIGRFSLRGQRGSHVRPGELLTSSLIRVCNVSRHEGGVETKMNSRRLEVASRRIWLPLGVEKPPVWDVSGMRINFDDDGIGAVPLSALGMQEGKGELERPVVSAPLTFGESASIGQTVIVPAGLPLGPHHSFYALAHHPTGQTPSLEEFYQQGAVPSELVTQAKEQYFAGARPAAL